MAGRTHLQHALPITFGYKAAVWLVDGPPSPGAAAPSAPRVLVGQFAGAAGTLASLGTGGLEVHEALMAELGLAEPDITWHVARDGMAEAVLLLGLVTGSARQDRHRHDADDADRDRRSIRAVRHRRGASSPCRRSVDPRPIPVGYAEFPSPCSPPAMASHTAA